MKEKLEQLIRDYDKRMGIIRTNRREMQRQESQNKSIRSELNAIKKELYDLVKPELEKGKTLYRISIENFGKIDKRFHVLFGIFNRK